MVGTLVVNDGQTSSASFDFLADKSLHQTGSGQLIFAPVIKVETRNNVGVTLTSNLVTFTEGAVNTNLTFGMDESGQTTVGGGVDAKASLDVVGDTIHIVSKGEADAGVKITAKGAVDKAVGEGYLTNALSVKTVTREGKKVWLVIGLKGLDIKNIYIDVTTGNVVAVE